MKKNLLMSIEREILRRVVKTRTNIRITIERNFPLN